jgi:D-threo-aldose 1-dehydrogenase
VNYRYSTPSEEILQRVRALRAACEGHGVALRAAALQFPFLHPAVASVVVGCRNPTEVEQNLLDLDTPIPVQLWADLVHQQLINPAVVRHLEASD